MTPTESTVKVAILDDYQNAALQMADWSPLAGRATITVFNDHLDDPDAGRSTGTVRGRLRHA